MTYSVLEFSLQGVKLNYSHVVLYIRNSILCNSMSEMSEVLVGTQQIFNLLRLSDINIL